MTEIVGRELADFPDRVVYNFGCNCGWWGIARVPCARMQVSCPRCREIYLQRRMEDGTWRLLALMH